MKDEKEKVKESQSRNVTPSLAIPIGCRVGGVTLGIYVGFDSPSIIRYLEPLTRYVLIPHFTDCHFNENVLPPLGEEKPVLE